MKHILTQTILQITAGILLITLSFGSIGLLYFGGDDFTALYNAQQRIFLPYPYYSDSLVMFPLYQLFHLNTVPYYVLSIALFSITAAFVCWLAQLLFQNKLETILAGLFYIFSSVGIGAMASMSEGIRHLYLILQLATICLFLITIRQKRRWQYATSIILFGVTVFLYPFRAFSFIFLLFFIKLLYQSKPINKIAFFLHLFPFVILTFFVYFILPHFFVINDRPFSLFMLMQRNNITAFLHYTLTFLFLFIPNTAIQKFMPFNTVLFPLKLFSLFFLFVTMTFIFSLRKKSESKPILLSFLFILTTLAGFFVYSSDYYQTSYRYLMTVRPFVALFLAGIAAFAFSPKIHSSAIKIGTVLFLVIIFLLHMWEYTSILRQEVTYRGTYVRNAIASVRQAVPTLRDYSIFFIDGTTNELRDQFMAGFRVGRLPGGAALAIYYHTTYDTIEITDRIHCDNFVSLLSRWKGKKIMVYYFLATPNGVVRGDPKKAFKLCNIDASDI